MKIKLKIFLLIIPIIIFLNNYCLGAVNVTGKNFALHNQSYGRKTGYYYISTQSGVKPATKIVETNKEGTVEKNTNKETSVYSLLNNNKVAFTNRERKVENYTQNFSLEDYESINNIYKSGLPSDKTAYNQLAWVLNNMCIPDNQLSKQALLLLAGLDVNSFKNFTVEGMEQEDVEKDIIETIQQAAIWYFTNPEGEYHPTDSLKIFFSSDDKTTKDINEYNKQTPNDAINKLYQYLINEAKRAVNSGYSYSKEAKKSPIVFNKDSAVINTIGNNYVIGPYNISSATSNCTLQVSINNGRNQLQDVKILGQDQKTELSGSSINQKIISNIGRDFYISIPTTTAAEKINIEVETNYNERELNYWTTSANKIKSSQPLIVVKEHAKSEVQTASKSISKPIFDLSLRQFVTTINDEKPENTREPEYKQSDLKMLAIGQSALDNGTTLVKKTKKDALDVNTNDKVIFTIRIYNEGQMNGIAETITEYLPSGLEMLPIEESEINRNFKWKKDSNNPTKLTTDYLKESNIEAFNLTPENEEYKIDYKDVQLECKVTSTIKTTDTALKPVAEISNSLNDSNSKDRDSISNNLSEEQKNDYNPGTSSEGKGYEDDDDYENLIVRGKYFDLSLRSFISEVYDINNRKAEYQREPRADTSPITSGNVTANYLGTKGPVSVEVGSTIIYTVRVYNEGQVEGYADEITEHLPQELEYVNDEFNAKNGWIIDTTDATQRTLKSSALSKSNDDDNAIKAFDFNSNELSYKEIKLKCKVKLESEALKEITTITEITKSSNSAKLADRDNKANVSLPSDSDLLNYRGNKDNKEELSDNNYYYKGQEDDDDFDKIILEKFDLALRTFITGHNGKEVKDRIPEVDTSNYGENIDNKNITTFKYNHKKDDFRVCQNDTVTFTIRIYNEGTQDGYASMVGNSIPDGLEYIQDDETNIKYNWKYYDKDGNETSDPSSAKYVSTNYLSKQQESSAGNNLIKSYNANNQLNYKELKIVFKVTKDNSSEERTILSNAQIIQASDSSGGKVSDVDSSPNDWQENEDDQDTEKLYVRFFDFSLKMMVEKAIIVEGGHEKENPTSHLIDEEIEPVVSVSVDRKDIQNTVVKFKFIIKVSNDGEIEGYAKEISDYVPEGLKFNQADNLKWKENDGKIVTDQLKDELLQPGDFKTVDLILTWVNDETNTGTKTNYAEISETKNNTGSEDINSTPNNKKENENDMDKSSIEITTSAGIPTKYIILIAGLLFIIIIAIILIKKLVL